MKRTFIYISLFCISIFSSARPAYAGTEKFLLQQFDNSSGLSNSSVNTVFQDGDQLLWAGSWDGLNMFDGTDFRVFNYSGSREPGSSIGNNVILDIAEGSGNNIWINTIGGISRIEKRTGRIFQYFYNTSSRRRVSEKEYSIAADKSGNVYCYSRTDGLSRFDTKTNSFLKAGLPSLRGKHISKMLFDQSGRLWLLDSAGEVLICRDDKSVLKIVRVLQGRTPAENVFRVGANVIVSCNGALYLFDAALNYKSFPETPSEIKSIARYHSNYVIITGNQELQVFDREFTKSSFLSAEFAKLRGIRTTSVYASKEGNLWIGTDGNGLIKICPLTRHFGLISSKQGYAFNKPVRSFVEINDDLWVGTKGTGIIRFSGFGKQQDILKPSDFLNTSSGLDNNSVFALKKGPYPYVYIGTDGKGLSVYNLRSGKIINWADIKGTSSLPSFGSVYAILPDRDNSVWLGTSGNGLIHLSLATAPSGALSVKNFRQYLSEKTKGLANDIIYALTLTSDRFLWIACRYGGLSVLDKQTGVFRTFRASGHAGSLSNNDVLSLYCDAGKGLWIGTSYGLNYLSAGQLLKPTPAFRKFTMSDGLPNNTIHAISQAADGDIWISTNKGLARVKLSSGIITTFNENDGLQSNEFSDGAILKSDNGQLFFGGIYGFNYFHPADLKENEERANLLISHLQIGNKTASENQLLVLTPSSSRPQACITDRDMNFFRLVLKPVNFANPVKNQLTYKLEGYDKNWNYSGTDGLIAYNNVNPGNYTLLVRWPDGNGSWTSPVPVIRLTVKQYFWLSYPALVFYLLITVISAYLFHRYRKNKIEMKFRLEMEHQLREKDESIHQQRLNFFTNIAHEIQTPLTLIVGSIEHFLHSGKNESLKGRENGYFLSLVHQHSLRLTYLVQQLMEFRKAEAGFLGKTINYIDISKMLCSLTALFLPESKKNGRPFIVEIQEGLAGFVDKDKLEKILFNLLSNAFKHSSSEDLIRFSATYDKVKNVLEITVSNTGCRMKREDIGLLFNRFYTSSETSSGKPSTGIGLAFAKELALLIGAEIGARLEETDTIVFTLAVPIAATSDQNIENEVATSAPSYLHEALLQHYEQPPLTDAVEENKSSLIEGLHKNSKCSILVVEDEPELRFLLHDVLKEQYIVYEAGNGIEALELLRKTTPDLIISDVMMPDMDGITLCNEVKNTPATAQIPFIMLSAKGTEENKQEGYESGADAYIPKPFNLNYLQVRIRKLLDYHIRMQNLIKDQNIASQFMNADIADMDKAFLESVLKVIEHNLDEPDLNASLIEDKLAMSKMQLYRKLKALAGMTPAEFIKRVRLKHASDMLLNSQFTVSEIIYKTGFNSKSYFFREFKKIYQCAPNDYRARQHEIAAKEDQEV